jgi:hypothetical protein
MTTECAGCGKIFKRLEMHIGGCRPYQNLQKYQETNERKDQEIKHLERENKSLKQENKRLLERINVTTNYNVQNNYFQHIQISLNQIELFTLEAVELIRQALPHYKEKKDALRQAFMDHMDKKDQISRNILKAFKDRNTVVKLLDNIPDEYCKEAVSKINDKLDTAENQITVTISELT